MQESSNPESPEWRACSEEFMKRLTETQDHRKPLSEIRREYGLAAPVRMDASGGNLMMASTEPHMHMMA